MKASLLSAAAASALVAAPARSAIIVVVNQAQFDAAIAVATEPGHTDTIDATGATGVIDAGTTLTLPGAATTITLELNAFSIGASVGNGRMTIDTGTGLLFGQGTTAGPALDIGDVFTGVLNINGGSVTLNILTQSPFIQIGADGGTGTVNMTSGTITIDDSNASPGQFGGLVVGYRHGHTDKRHIQPVGGHRLPVIRRAGHRRDRVRPRHHHARHRHLQSQRQRPVGT
jgi:hypothetical protein